MGANLDRFRSNGIDRAGAFSDGVFAIALTLLVLNFKLPDLHGSTAATDSALWRAIRDQSGTFVSYALSVFVIGRYWLVHHRMFRLFRRTDALLLELNVVALALVAFLPYPTALLGNYGDTRTATVLYAATVTAVGSLHAAIWWHADRAGLLEEEVSDVYRRHSAVRGIAMPAIFVCSIPVAFVDVTVAQLMWVSSVFIRFAFRSRYGSISDPYDEATPAAD